MFDLWRMRLDARRQRRAGQHEERLDRYVDRRLGLVPTRACHREARATYVGDDTLLCRVQGRYYLYASSRDLNLTPALATFGRVSPWLSRVIAGAVRPGMTVADIGANVGYFTMQLADHVGAGGRVHAFEPNEALARLIERSAIANHLHGRVTVHPVAVGESDGEGWLCFAGDALAGAAVHDRDWADRWTAGSERDATKTARPVPVRRLDTLPEAGAIAFAKIDVEGFEPEVWAGMAPLLDGEALRSVVVEYTPAHYRDLDGFVAALHRPGWCVALVDPESGPAPISRDAVANLDHGGCYDLLLTR